MKKLLTSSLILMLLSLNLSAQNIYIRGHLKVIAIGPDFIDFICEAPYDKICFSYITESISPATKSSDNFINKPGLLAPVQPKVQTIGITIDKEGFSKKVYRIRKEDFNEVI